MAKYTPFNQLLPTDRQIIRRLDPDGTEYIAEGAPGADPDADVFKCCAVVPIKDVDDNTIGSHVRHADGLFAPGWAGANLADLTYGPVYVEPEPDPEA